jgi:hypothetical protein
MCTNLLFDLVDGFLLPYIPGSVYEFVLAVSQVAVSLKLKPEFEGGSV